MKLSCQICKAVPATVHQYTIVGSGHEASCKVSHMCAGCARHEGLQVAPNQALSINNLPSQLSKKLLGPIKELLEANNADNSFEFDDAEKANTGKVCPDCGATEADFYSTKRFGCPNDYEVFEDLVNEVLEGIHGATEHSEISKEKLLQQLKNDLQEAAELELYEEAAQLRDEIREIEDNRRKAEK